MGWCFRLKKLLADENQAYEREYMSTIKSPLERAAELRAKAKQIKENRENENAAFVKQKLEQKWRYLLKSRRRKRKKQLFTFICLPCLDPNATNCELSDPSNFRPASEWTTFVKWKRRSAANVIVWYELWLAFMSFERD